STTSLTFGTWTTTATMVRRGAATSITLRSGFSLPTNKNDKIVKPHGQVRFAGGHPSAESWVCPRSNGRTLREPEARFDSLFHDARHRRRGFRRRHRRKSGEGFAAPESNGVDAAGADILPPLRREHLQRGRVGQRA